MRVDFFRHDLNSDASARVAEVLASATLTSGPVGRQVEEQLKDFFGAPHALLVNSWTNGALAALLALGLKPGDEVIVPAMTFIATANVVELLGAKPVFVDVDPATLLMTPEAAAAARTAKTKAVIAVHLYGQMCDMAAFRAALPGIALIEDAAHCFEGELNSEPPGRHSDAAIFSFYATKNVTCGEGGAIITHREDLAERIRKTRLHGMSAGAADRFSAGQYRHWDMDCLGVKANLPDLLAALLPDQIASIRARLPLRESIAQRYKKGLSGLPISLPAEAPGRLSARHIFPIHVDPSIRDRVLADLNAAGIGATVNYRSVPLRAYYRERYGWQAEDHPVSAHWGEGTLTLPLYPSLEPAQVDAVIDALKAALDRHVMAHV